MKSSKLRIVVEFVYPFLYILFVFGSRFVRNFKFAFFYQSINQRIFISGYASMFPMCASINLFFIFRKFLAIQMRTRIIKQTQTLYKNILLNGFEQNLLRNKNKIERRNLLFYLSFVRIAGLKFDFARENIFLVSLSNLIKEE